MASLQNTSVSLPFKKRRNLFYAAFIVINLFLSCYYLDVWITPNTASRAFPVLTLYEDNTLVIDKYEHRAVDVSKINNHIYSNKAPLSTFLVYPFYLIYRSIGLTDIKEETLKKYPIYIDENIKPFLDGRSDIFPGISGILILGDILCGAIPFVLILLLTLIAIKDSPLKVSPVTVVMFAFYTSFIIAYSGAYTSHILCGLLALTSYIFLKKKRYILSGVMIGLAVTAEYPVGILIPVWALVIYLNERKFSKPFLFGLGVIPGALIVMYYNYHLTGSIIKASNSFETHQHKKSLEDIGFYPPTFTSLWGLTFSTYRGILYYTPVLLLIVWHGIKFGYQRLSEKMNTFMELVKAGLKSYLPLGFLAYLLLYASYYEWYGGWAYGPRYLIPIAVIMLYEGLKFLSSKPFSSYALYIIAGLGLLVTWMDKSTKLFELPNNPALFSNPVLSIIFPDFIHHKFNTNTLPVLMFDSNPVLAIYAWPVLFMLGLIVLSVWYSKLYPAKKNNCKIFIPVVPFLVCYSAIIIAQSVNGNNNLRLNESGIFGTWKNFDLGSSYMTDAENSQYPDTKAQYYSLAAAEFQKVVQSTPAYEDYYLYLGDCLSKAGYNDSALDEYKNLLKINPRASLAEKRMGLIYANQDKNDSAVRYFLLSCKADSNINALISVSTVYLRSEKYAEALHYDSILLKKDPENNAGLNIIYLSYNGLGLKYMADDEYDKALAEFDKAVKYYSNSGVAFNNIGTVYQKKGDVEKAKYFYQMALSKDPQNSEYATNLELLNKKK